MKQECGNCNYHTWESDPKMKFTWMECKLTQNKDQKVNECNTWKPQSCDDCNFFQETKEGWEVCSHGNYPETLQEVHECKNFSSRL